MRLFIVSSQFIQKFNFFFCVICSLHLSLCTAAWVTFDGVGSNRACLLAATLLLRMLRVYLSLSPLIFLSLSFSVHIPRIESLIRLYLKKLQIESIFSSARLRVSGRSRAGVLVFVCFVSNSSFAFRS